MEAPTNLAHERQAALLGTQRRIEGTFYFLLVPLFFLAGRLVQLQALPSHNQGPPGLKHQVLPARRGDILACDGTAMAMTQDEFDICANPRAVSDKPRLARLLSESIGGDEAEYLPLLDKTQRSDGRPNRYVRLARHVEAARMEKLWLRMNGPAQEKRAERTLRKKFWEPVTVAATPHRYYPAAGFASQLIGFTAGSGHGVDGLERGWDRVLAGRNGSIESRVDAAGRPIPGFVKRLREPVPGQTIVTTIDPAVQSAADDTLGKLVAKYHPNFAVAVVLRPSTGEIVALSTAPTYDLNHRPADIAQMATERCLNFAYEPGSTFKIITASAAVEQVPDWRSHSFYCNGVQQVGRHTLHCWISSTSKHRHGQETLSDSIRDSCNFGVYGFARLVGAPKMLDYARRFGLSRQAGVTGISEHPGLLPENDPHHWSEEQLANFSFGQGMLMTPLQLARVAAVVANDGVMMKPLLVREIRDAEGKVVQRFLPEPEAERVIKPETAHLVRGMMERVVREGTAKQFVFVPGYLSAGKTGSAQKAVGRHGYAAGRFISSFVGFLPAAEPEFVIMVMADEPHGSHWGSEVCGPAYAEIASRAMLRLRLRNGPNAPAPNPALMQNPVKHVA